MVVPTFIQARNHGLSHRPPPKVEETQEQEPPPKAPPVSIVYPYYGLVGRTTVDGHNYLIFDHGVVHDENCPCKK